MNLEKGLNEFKRELLGLDELVAGKQVAIGTSVGGAKAEVDEKLNWRVIGTVPDPAKLEKIKAMALKKFKADITKSGDTTKAYDVVIDFKTNGLTVTSDDGKVLFNGTIN